MKKIVIKYLMMYMAFILGIILFSVGITNLFSSLLLFVGGYGAIKNTLDYRLINRNINVIKEECCINLGENLIDNNGRDDVLDNETIHCSVIKPINRNVEDVVGLKRIRRYGRVRRRY